MKDIASGYHGLWLIVDLNIDWLLWIGATVAAFLSVAYLTAP